MPIPIFCRVACCARSIRRRAAAASNVCGRSNRCVRHALLFHAAAQFLEENALVRGVLIDQHEAVGIFHQNVEFVEDADDLELLSRRRGGVVGKGSVADPLVFGRRGERALNF